MPRGRPSPKKPKGFGAFIARQRAKNVKWKKIRRLVPLSDEEIRFLIKKRRIPSCAGIYLRVWDPADPMFWIACIGVLQNFLTVTFADVISSYFLWTTLHKTVSFYIFVSSSLFIVRFPVYNPIVLKWAVELKIDEVNTTIWEHKHSQDADLERLKARRSSLWREWTRSHSEPTRRTELESHIEVISRGIDSIETDVKESAILFQDLLHQLEQLRDLIAIESAIAPVQETETALNRAKLSALEAQRTLNEAEKWRPEMTIELRQGLEKLTALTVVARNRSEELATLRSRTDETSPLFSQDKP